MRDGWIKTPIGDVAQVLSGFAFKSELFNQSEGMPLIRIRDLPKRNQTEALYSGSYEDRYVVRHGDFLIGMDGEFHCYEWGGKDALLNQRVCRIQDFKINFVEPRFIFFAVNQYLDKIEQDTGYTTVKHISSKQILAINIPLPPLPEQKRIVDLISSVDSYIEALEQQLESAKKSRNAVLHELLTAGSDDWEYKILSDICEVRDGTHDSPKPSNEGFALVTSKNIKDGRLDLDSAYLISLNDYVEVNKRSKVEQYNLLISMIGTIGEVIVVEEEPDFAIKNVGLLKSTEPILSRYLCHYLGSQLGKNAISLSVSGSTQKFISLGKLRVLPVLYPPRENQKAIVEAMSLFDQQISKNLEVAARIKNLRSSLLSDLLSGEHEIPASYDKVIGAA
jgi:type I restriction enzyme S subunit